MRLSLVAALDREFAIGKDNGLPWHLPDDLKRFKALTLGKPLLMGRRTAESLGRALPGRRNLVLTRSGAVPHADMEAVADLDTALRTTEGSGELCVIGEAGMLVASYLTQDVWLTETAGSAKNWDTLSRLGGDVESSTVRFGLRRVEPLQAELAAFAQCVLDDTPEPVTAYDGCRALIAALAVRNSAENSRPVRLLGMPTAPALVHAAEPVSAGA